MMTEKVDIAGRTALTRSTHRSISQRDCSIVSLRRAAAVYSSPAKTSAEWCAVVHCLPRHQFQVFFSLGYPTLSTETVTLFCGCRIDHRPHSNAQT